MQKNKKVFDALQVILGEMNNTYQRDVVNTLTQAILAEHRSIQQIFWSSMLLIQIRYADTGEFDLRNEQSVKFAKAVRKLAIEMNMDFGMARV